MKKKKVLLINLPLPDYYKKTQKGNTQIFSDYIKCITDKNLIEVLTLPRDILESFNNRALCEEILALEPDLVGFSSYLWNIERNISISKMLKEKGIVTLTGGPEISADNGYIFKNNYFDCYFEGQSEYVLSDFLSKDISQNTKNNYIKSIDTVNFNIFIPDYIKTTADYKYDGLLYLETERGCPYKCVYCAYNKFNQKIKSIDPEIFRSSIEQIFNMPVKEVYLLAPTLNRNKKTFNDYLDILISEKIKTGKHINFFGELRAELLSDNEITKLARAGFNEIEFGIQSLSKDAFSRLERKDIKFEFIDFTKKLLSNGITPLIDFIAGLPHDTYKNIMTTVELLDKNNLLEYSNFYHLHVLANTELRKIFNRNKFIYDKKSPYFSYQTDTLSFQDIQKVYYELEVKKGITDFVDFFDFSKENFYYLKSETDLLQLTKSPFYHTSAYLSLDNFNQNHILNFYSSLFSMNPEIFHKLFIYSDKKINADFLKNLNGIFSEHKNYYDLYKEGISCGNDAGFSKVFHILVKPDTEDKYIKKMQNTFFTDFVVFPDEQALYDKYKDKIKKICIKEMSFLYLFNDKLNIKESFIRIFP